MAKRGVCITQNVNLFSQQPTNAEKAAIIAAFLFKLPTKCIFGLTFYQKIYS